MITLALVREFANAIVVKRIKQGNSITYFPNYVKALPVHKLPSEFKKWIFEWETKKCIVEEKPNFLRIEELWNDLGDLFTQVLRLLNINDIRELKTVATIDRIRQIMVKEVKGEIKRRIQKDRDYFEKGDFENKAMTKGQIISILDMWARLNISKYFNNNHYAGIKDVGHFIKALDMDGFEDGDKLNKSFTNFLIKYLIWSTQKLAFIRLDSEKATCLEYLIKYIETTNKRDKHEVRNAFISFTRIKKGKNRIGNDAGEYREGRPGLWGEVYTFKGKIIKRDTAQSTFVTFSNRTKKASEPKKGKKTSKAKKVTRSKQSKSTNKVSTARKTTRKNN